MVIRKLPSKSDKDRKKMLNDSIEYAKKAVSLDFKDSESWYVLGNAHLTNFFMGGQKYENLDFALKAYTQAEKLQVYKNPDLYFNRATIFNYLERYSDAITDYEVSHSIDPNLGAKDKAASIYGYVLNVCGLIKKKGALKSKKLINLVKSVPKSIGEVKFMKAQDTAEKPKEEKKEVPDEEHKEEAKEEAKDNTKVEEKPIKYTVKPVPELERGINRGTVFTSKLI